MALESDTISAVTTKATKTSVTPNVDSSTEINDGDPTISGTKAIQKLKGGASDEVHRLEFEIETTLGKLLEAEIDVHIEEI